MDATFVQKKTKTTPKEASRTLAVSVLALVRALGPMLSDSASAELARGLELLLERL